MPNHLAYMYVEIVAVPLNKDGQIVKKTAYVVFAVTIEGIKDILGIWIGEAESSKFWMSVLTDLRNRGVKDLLIGYRPDLCEIHAKLLGIVVCQVFCFQLSI
jgi:transposase-like protein